MAGASALSSLAVACRTRSLLSPLTTPGGTVIKFSRKLHILSGSWRGETRAEWVARHAGAVSADTVPSEPRDFRAFIISQFCVVDRASA
jgi:hypothetical protein